MSIEEVFLDILDKTSTFYKKRFFVSKDNPAANSLISLLKHFSENYKLFVPFVIDQEMSDYMDETREELSETYQSMSRYSIENSVDIVQMPYKLCVLEYSDYSIYVMYEAHSSLYFLLPKNQSKDSAMDLQNAFVLVEEEDIDDAGELGCVINGSFGVDETVAGVIVSEVCIFRALINTQSYKPFLQKQTKNKKVQRRGKIKNVTVETGRILLKLPSVQIRYGAGVRRRSHSPKRPHIRRGHVRRNRDGKLGFIQATFVNGGASNSPEYRLFT